MPFIGCYFGMKFQVDMQERLAEILMPYFEHKKYIWHPELNQFIRPTRFGHAGIVASVTSSGGSLHIEYHIGIRHDLVEKALGALYGTPPYYQSQSYTLLVSYGMLNHINGSGRFICHNANDLYRIADTFTHFMDMKGFDFLDHYKRLAHIDKLFNEHMDVARRWSNHSYQYSFRAMVVAKLCHREDIDILSGIHRNFLIERGHIGALVEKFDANFAQLKILSFN